MLLHIDFIDIAVTISGGLISNAYNMTSEEIIKNADEYLYGVKNSTHFKLK